MRSYLNRWTLAVAWVVAMLVVWTLFVPSGLSVTTFVLCGIAGLLALFAGGALMRGGTPPHSMNQIISELEEGPRPAAGKLKT